MYLLTLASALLLASPPDPDSVIRETLAKHWQSAQTQSQALCELAWFDPSATPEVRARAREELVRFGQQALPTVAAAVERVDPSKTAELVDVLVQERASVRGPTPPDYYPALDAVLWRGDRAGRRRALPLLAAAEWRMSVLPMIDVAKEDPALVPDVVQALQRLGDDRARFFLEKVLHEGGPGESTAAAVALATIGSRAREPLRAALRSPRKEIRLSAARALLPVLTDAELTAVYEYLSAHGDDDPATTDALRRGCHVVEEHLEARRAAEAKSGDDGF